MNFNQGNMMSQGSMGQPPYGGGGQPLQPPQGMRQFPTTALAQMTPQQLQQLKNHPQYQEIIRQYAHRQMMLQQQQQQHQQQPPQQPPQPMQAPMGQPTPAMMAQRQHSGAMPRQPGPMAAAQLAARQGMGVAPGGVPQPHPAAVGAGQLPPGVAPGAAPPAMALAAGGGGIDPTTGRRVTAAVPAVPGAIAAAAAAAAVTQPPPPPPIEANAIQVPPIINPDQYLRPVLASLKSNKMDDAHYWLKQLEKEGKLVPSDVKLYENIVDADSKYLKQYKEQLRGLKQLLADLQRDLVSYNEIKQLRVNAITLLSKHTFNNSIWGEGYQGYGNGITNAPTKLVLPGKDITDRQINERVLKQRQLGEKPQFVPIRLEFDFERDKFKLRDTFLWDLNEEVITVELFVHQLIDDYKFVLAENYSTILASVKEQIAEYTKIPERTLGELRVPIKVNVVINDTQLVDKFEWDILNCHEGDAEEFATQLCDEMGLPGEFATAVSHIIREQTQMYHKALLFTGYSFDGAPIQEEETRLHLLPQLKTGDDFYTVLRNSQAVIEYGPLVQKLSQQEVEKLDKEIERDLRRKRRHNLNEDHLALLAGALGAASNRGPLLRRMAFHSGRGGPALPDLSDVPKTFRTPAPSSVLPGAADVGVPRVYDYAEVSAFKTQVRNPDYRPPLAADAVRYHWDANHGTFMVKLKFRRLN